MFLSLNNKDAACFLFRNRNKECWARKPQTPGKHAAGSFSNEIVTESGIHYRCRVFGGGGTAGGGQARQSRAENHAVIRLGGDRSAQNFHNYVMNMKDFCN